MAHDIPPLENGPRSPRDLPFWGPIGTLGLGLVLLGFFLSAIVHQFEEPRSAASNPVSCNQNFAASLPSVNGRLL